MPWTRLDDGFYANPKILALSDRAFRLYVVSLNWSVAHLTDGNVTNVAAAAALPQVGSAARKRTIRELIDAGLWLETDVDSWRIRAFSEFQETKAQVEERREKWRQQKASQRAVDPSDDPPSDEVSTADTTEDSPPASSRTRGSARAPTPTPLPITSPLPSVEESAPLLFDSARSDESSGLEVWVDSTGKVRQRVDRLWDVACEIWGEPATKTERGKRNAEISQLREAGVSPEELKLLFGKAVVKRGYRPGPAGIVRNLGDLRHGVDAPSPQELRRVERELARGSQETEIRRRMGGGG